MIARLALALLLLPQVTPARTQVVLGSRSDALVDEGARLLDAGRSVKGIELTLEALAGPDLSISSTAVAYSNLCMGHVQLKAFTKALEYCNKAIELAPEDWRYRNNRATAYLGLGDPASALKDLEYAWDKAPENFVISYNITIARSRLRDGRQAMP